MPFHRERENSLEGVEILGSAEDGRAAVGSVQHVIGDATWGLSKSARHG